MSTTPEIETAIARIVAATPLQDEDVRNIMCARTLADVQELAALYAAAGRPADRTTYQTMAVVLGDVVEGAAKLAPLIGILQQLAGVV